MELWENLAVVVGAASAIAIAVVWLASAIERRRERRLGDVFLRRPR